MIPALLALVAAAALAAAPASGASSDTRATVSGRVVSPTGTPVANATVRVIASRFARGSRATLTPLVVSTDESGRFVAAGLFGTAFLVHVEASGFAPFAKNDVTAGASLELGVATGHALSGLVVDATTEEPLPGARVLGCDRTGTAFGDASCTQATSDERGSFRLEHLSAGPVTIEAVAPGRAWSPAVSLELPLAEAPTEPLSLALPAGGSLGGRVADPTGRPIGGARIRLRYAGEPEMAIPDPRERPIWTDADGKFVVPGLPAGLRVKLKAERGEASSTEIGPFTVDAGSAQENLEIELRIPARLTFRLMDADGQPMSPPVGGSLSQDDGPPRWIDPGSIDALGAGTFSADELDGGTFDLRLEPEGFLPIAIGGVVLRSGETTHLGDLALDPGESIRGRVLDTGGLPIERARIEGTTIEGRFPRRLQTTSLGDGSYEIRGLAADAVVTLRAEAEGHASVERPQVRVADARPVDLVLRPWGRIRGRVVDENGEPFTVFRIRPVIEADDDAWRSVMRGNRLPTRPFQDPEGLFVYDDVPPGTYTILASVEGKPDGRRTGLVVGDGTTVDSGRIVIGPGIELRGHVVEPSGAPVAGARVEVVESGLHRVMGYPDRVPAAATDPEGAFVIPGLVAGLTRLRADHDDFAPAFANLEIEPDRAPDEVVLRLRSGGRVVGTVRDRERHPIAGARIGASPADDFFGADEIRSATTDADGKYEIARLAPGGYRVIRMDRAARDPLDLEMRQAAVADGETVVVDFDESTRIHLSGLVLRGDETLPGASLIFVPGGSAAEALEGFRSTRAAGDGRYEIDLDRNGPYRVFVGSDELGPIGGGAVVEIVVPQEPAPTADIVLRGGGVAGTVLDEDGRTLAGASVLAHPTGTAPDHLAGPSGAATTDASGRYRLEGLEAGTYDLSVSAPALEPGVRRGIAVGADTVTEGIDFRLGRGRIVRGRVVDAGGRGIAGATVLAAPEGSELPLGGSAEVTDINGAFRIVAPPDTALELVAIASGYAPVRATGIVASEDPESAPTVLVATPGGRLTVQVLDAAGAPIAGARLTLRAGAAWPAANWIDLLRPAPPTDAQGIARLEALAPGSYTVEAWVPGRTIAPAAAAVGEGGQTTVVLRASGPG